MGHGLIGSSDRESNFVSKYFPLFQNTNEDHSWPKTMYTDQGHQISEKLWDETLEELKFAGVKEKL
jgi:hypothetical protein